MTAPSHAILEKVQKNYQFRADPDGAVVVPHGTPDRAGTYKSQRNDDRVRVLFVGRLERRKGVDTLMKAAMRLAPRYPCAEFIFVGDDTIAGDNGKTYRAWFEEQFGRQLGRERVVFKGKVSEDELYRNYADCDVFCAPSRFESFGLILIEAMMFAKPVIACSVGGMSEIVEHGGNGFLAPVDDVRCPDEVPCGTYRICGDAATVRATFQGPLRIELHRGTHGRQDLANLRPFCPYLGPGRKHLK